MIDSINIANFLHTRVKQTLAYKRYIKTVHIGYVRDESYGNDYIRFTYEINVHETYWKELDFFEQEFTFEGSSYYIFTLSTRNNYSRENILLRLLEFRHIYESLTAITILKLEEELEANTSIKVKDISKFPDANYASKYLTSSLKNKQRGLNSYDFEIDVRQWAPLQHLSKKSQKIHKSERKKFNLTDRELNTITNISYTDIHYIILKYTIPIQVEGISIIEKVHIHTGKLVEALKKEILNETLYSRLDSHMAKWLVIYLYDHFLVDEKKEIIRQQQNIFLKHFPIQEGDILELTDRRLVIANSVFFSENNKVNVEYTILKTNLLLSERRRIIGLEQVSYILKKSDFLRYIEKNRIRHLSLLNRWMKSKKTSIVTKQFKPNLFI